MAVDPTPDVENPDASETPDAVDASEEPTSGGIGRKVMVVAAVLVAAALGAGMAYSQFGTIDRTAQGLFGAPDEDAPAEDTSIEYGEFMQIDGLVVNPAETGGSRYLMVSVGLESADPAVLEEIAMKDVVVRDAIIGLLSGKNVETLADVSTREGMKEEIRVLVNGILSGGEIDRLYFTQFMLQ